jgi:hypothetical protein
MNRWNESRKTAQVTWDWGQDLFYLLPSLLVKPRGKENWHSSPQVAQCTWTWALSSFPPHQCDLVILHGFAQKHGKVGPLQCPGDRYIGENKIEGSWWAGKFRDRIQVFRSWSKLNMHTIHPSIHASMRPCVHPSILSSITISTLPSEVKIKKTEDQHI